MTKNMQRKCHLFKANRFSKATGKNSARAGNDPEARAKACATSDLDRAVYDVVKKVISLKLCLKASKPAGNEMHCSSWEYLSGCWFFNAVSRVATPADPRVVPSENKQIKACYQSSLVHVNSVQCIIISAFTTVQGFTVCAKKLVEVSFVYLPWAKQKVQHMLD